MNVLSSSELSAEMRKHNSTFRVVDGSTLHWYLITTGTKLKVV